MKYRKVIFKIEDGRASYQKWKNHKIKIKGGASDRSEVNREKAKQMATIFEPYLKEILAQFPQKSMK